jgi:hypothetical protein
LYPRYYRRHESYWPEHHNKHLNKEKKEKCKN